MSSSRPQQGFRERWLVGQRIPFDQDQLSDKAVLLDLFGQCGKKDLHTSEKVATVIIVASGNDHADVGRVVFCQDLTTVAVSCPQMNPSALESGRENQETRCRVYLATRYIGFADYPLTLHTRFVVQVFEEKRRSVCD